jgi:hypothetical protein
MLPLSAVLASREVLHVSSTCYCRKHKKHNIIEISSLDNPSTDHFILPYTLVHTNRITIKTYAIEDISTIVDRFLDNIFVQNQNILLTPLDKSLHLKVIDGRDSSASAIIYYAEVDLLIGYYSERIKLYVMKLVCYNIILGYI